MSSQQNSLIHFSNIARSQIEKLFSVAFQFSQSMTLPSRQGQTAALLFFEPSTRTRMSFETACARLGIYPLLMDGVSGTSLEKGETIEDTILNISAMKPSAFIIRAGDDLDFDLIKAKIQQPIINAGWGKRGHPTQALLDIYTISQQKRDLQNLKLLIVGDVRHSRVAASHFELAKIIGYEIALCGPAEFLPENTDYLQFQNLSEGLSWANAIMCLRVQLERHEVKYSLQSYRSEFGLNQERLKELTDDHLILHPGPINQGVEMDFETIHSPNSLIFQQVENGVYVRQALLDLILRGEWR